MEYHVDRVVETQLGLLHQQLRECPSQAGRERRDEQEVEAKQVELRGLIREHDEAR